jgi:hypothetical protein
MITLKWYQNPAAVNHKTIGRGRINKKYGREGELGRGEGV